MLLASALVLVVAAPPKAPAPEKLDALDFNNGTMLVKESGSYGSGVGAWAAWRLADGSPTGWCSASGEPSGASFEWELDGAWTLETFVVDASTTEEASYPGISVKKLTLSVANGAGAWKSLGTFEVAQHAKKSFPLPKGTTATRVKVDIVGNHGHAEYTEVAELDLLGTRNAPSPMRSFAGVYTSNYGPMRFEQEGDQVFGCYDYGSIVGLLWGTVSGRVVQLTWYEEGESSTREGTGTFASVKDEAGQQGFWGVWFENGELANIWSGEASDAPPVCKVSRKGQLERQLRKKGHVALYGIRFDVNSDVPRPESEATLKELATLLSGTQLAVTIEGHTDATNTDAYNLDLSNRRAVAVMKWLTEHGVKASQLTSKGFGKTKPVADNVTVQGRALNRRVEVSLAK
ncbi:MAG: OmpA family protein [Archangiaceae bacterium]|nr:OmpA family protein [Archangiaceae bacterium]